MTLRRETGDTARLRIGVFLLTVIPLGLLALGLAGQLPPLADAASDLGVRAGFDFLITFFLPGGLAPFALGLYTLYLLGRDIEEELGTVGLLIVMGAAAAAGVAALYLDPDVTLGSATAVGEVARVSALAGLAGAFALTREGSASACGTLGLLLLLGGSPLGIGAHDVLLTAPERLALAGSVIELGLGAEFGWMTAPLAGLTAGLLLAFLLDLSRQLELCATPSSAG